MRDFLVYDGWRQHLRKALTIAILQLAFTTLVHAQVETCSPEAEVVFNQAVSTYRAVLVEVLGAERRGRWRPSGTFRQGFFRQNARALRDIRVLLNRQDTNQATLLKPFGRLVNVRLPTGVTLPHAVRRGESARFRRSVRDYFACRGE